MLLFAVAMLSEIIPCSRFVFDICQCQCCRLDSQTQCKMLWIMFFFIKCCLNVFFNSTLARSSSHLYSSPLFLAKEWTYAGNVVSSDFIIIVLFASAVLYYCDGIVIDTWLTDRHRQLIYLFGFRVCISLKKLSESHPNEPSSHPPPTVCLSLFILLLPVHLFHLSLHKLREQIERVNQPARETAYKYWA